MLLKYSISVLIFATSISIAIGQFDIKFFSCRLSYPAECQKDEDISEDNENTAPIEGFYWRDFHGNIPDDAFPVGGNDQSPQTYVALAYDEKFDGTFASAIREGNYYVYNILGETPRKITQKIVILCTKQPDRMKWIRVMKDEEVDWSNKALVDGGSHVKKTMRIRNYVARVTSSNINYIGGINETKNSMKYADMEGLPKTAAESEYEVLYYQKNSGDGNDTEADKETSTEMKGSFIKHIYQYCVNPNSVIPSYYKSIKFAGVSLVCTNQKEKKKMTKNKAATATPDPSMDYYWKPSIFFSKTDAFESGNKTGTAGALYIARTWTRHGYGLDVGYTDENTGYVAFSDGYSSTAEIYNLKILSTNNPEKLKWIPSNSSSLVMMDKTYLIPGGMKANGTLTYIGRVKKGEDKIPASIRLTDKGAYAYYFTDLNAATNFEVLSYNA